MIPNLWKQITEIDIQAVELTTKEDILKNVGNRAVLEHHWLP